MATGAAALHLAQSQRASTSKKAKVSQAASSQPSDLTLEERLQKLELGQQLHSQAIVQQGHKINRLAAAETVIWITDPTLKQQASEAHEAWKTHKPDKGPHPMGSHGHVVHALILQTMAQAVQDLAGKPAEAEAFSKQPQLKALIQFLNISEEQSPLEAIHTYLTALNNRPMTDCVRNCRPISKRKVQQDKPWGWSVIYETGLDGSRLKDVMVLHGQPLHENLTLIAVRKGIPKADRNLKQITNMVPGWRRENADEEGEGDEEDEAMQATPMKEAKRGRK